MGRPDQRRDAKGRWASEGGNTVAAAVVVTVALAAAGTGFSPAAIGDALSGGRGIDGPSRPGAGTSAGDDLDGQDVGGRGDAVARISARLISRVTARLARAELRALRPRVRVDTDCAAHAYGQVQAFLRAHPCVRVYRALFDVTDRHGVMALLAVAWVQMPTAELAGQLKQLMDSPGTGNITDLSRERGGLRFTGQYYASAIEGTAAINAQAHPGGQGAAVIDLAQRVIAQAL